MDVGLECSVVIIVGGVMVVVVVSGWGCLFSWVVEVEHDSAPSTTGVSELAHLLFKVISIL